MNNIEWKDGAVCMAGCDIWSVYDDNHLEADGGALFSFDAVIGYKDFQLNEVRIGDYIERSELDTEQKYNDVVGLFGLFGIERAEGALYENTERAFGGGDDRLCVYEDMKLWGCSERIHSARKLTYNQIIAIGKLKRMMLECEDVKTQLEKWGEYSVDSSYSESPNCSDQVKNPSHYQLIEGVESIEIIARSMTKEQWKGFCLGNMLKYRIRAGKKDALQQDIEKANFYGELYEMHKEKCYDN